MKNKLQKLSELDDAIAALQRSLDIDESENDDDDQDDINDNNFADGDGSKYHMDTVKKSEIYSETNVKRSRKETYIEECDGLGNVFRIYSGEQDRIQPLPKYLLPSTSCKTKLKSEVVPRESKVFQW